MSYAKAAASGPKQSPEEARAPLLNEVLPTETSTSSLVDVDSPHISTVDSSFSDHHLHTKTQAEQHDREAADADLEHAKEESKKRAAQAKAKAKHAAETAKEKAGELKDKAQRNSDNPVVVGNVVGLVAVGAIVGFGAYRQYAAGELTWKVAGVWAAGLGALAVGDAYFSHLLFQNKYPTK